MIIICDLCNKYVCSSSCPNFNGYVVEIGRRAAICDQCEQNIYTSDEVYCYNDKYICSECAEELISHELLELLECNDIKDFFDMLL